MIDYIQLRFWRVKVLIPISTIFFFLLSFRVLRSLLFNRQTPNMKVIDGVLLNSYETECPIFELRIIGRALIPKRFWSIAVTQNTVHITLISFYCTHLFSNKFSRLDRQPHSIIIPLP